MTNDQKDPKKAAAVSPRIASQRPLAAITFQLFQVVLGCSICALGIKGLILPNDFASSGVTGLAILLHELLPQVGIGTAYALLNVPIFFAAFHNVGKRFFFLSLAGAATLTCALGAIDFTIPVQDKVLAAVAAGILIGVGAGITLRARGSAGGADILAVILMRNFAVRLGNTMLFLNVAVLVLTSWVYSLEAALYTLIQIYVSAKLINLVVTGLSQRKAVMIISSKWKEINEEILKDFRRGATIIPAEGGFSHLEEKILYTIIDFRDLGSIKQLIRQIDPGAFVVIHDTLEVLNARIGNEPKW